MSDNELDVERWANPFYMKFLHGNFVSPKMHFEESQELWNERVRLALHEITPEIAGDLLSEKNWRGTLPGAWFCGLKKWDDFTLDIGRSLVQRRQGYVTQGYSFALARFASHASANYLRGRMNLVLKELVREDEVDWLLGAMLWIDQEIGTSHADDYIGLQQQRIKKVVENVLESEHPIPSYAELRNDVRTKFWQIMDYVNKHFPIA